MIFPYGTAVIAHPRRYTCRFPRPSSKHRIYKDFLRFCPSIFLSSSLPPTHFAFSSLPCSLFSFPVSSVGSPPLSIVPLSLTSIRTSVHIKQCRSIIRSRRVLSRKFVRLSRLRKARLLSLIVGRACVPVLFFFFYRSRRLLRFSFFLRDELESSPSFWLI